MRTSVLNNTALKFGISFKLLPVLISLSTSFVANAQTTHYTADSGVNLIDGASRQYSNLQPGDTVYLKAGNRGKLLIRNFYGAPGKPITFINQDGIVTISTNEYYGVSILNSHYIRFSGQGNSAFYGIQIKKVLNGAGIGIGGMSSDFEVDHISIENCSTEGIMAKTDPDCSFKASRDSFTQFNTNIHDNYIADVGNEGMYIGSSYYSGVHLTCNGRDTIVMPAVLNNVSVYNNIVKRTGWDGIQVSAAPVNCQVHHNSITEDSQAETPNQMSGILLGGGSKCSCYNNKISDGKGDGIEDHGLGGNKIYNNIIVNAGQTFQPGNSSMARHGIFVSDVSAIQDSSFCIIFNDIINPKSDGIRFQSIKSRNNIIASNLIINPGNYSLYENDNTSFTGNDAYVMLPLRTADVLLKNNFFSGNIADAGISVADYSPQAASVLINKGYQYNFGIATDFTDRKRLAGAYYDIGAVEYQSGDDRVSDTVKMKASLFPNPVQSQCIIRYLASDVSNISVSIYSLTGQLVLQQPFKVALPGIQQLKLDSGMLFRGSYLYCIRQGTTSASGRFEKL